MSVNVTVALSFHDALSIRYLFPCDLRCVNFSCLGLDDWKSCGLGLLFQRESLAENG